MSASTTAFLMRFSSSRMFPGQRWRLMAAIALGVSPRGSMSLYRAAQALAMLEGRGYCIPDDFKRLVLPLLSHRCVVSTRYVSTLKKGEQAEAILREIIEATPVPL